MLNCKAASLEEVANATAGLHSMPRTEPALYLLIWRQQATLRPSASASAARYPRPTMLPPLVESKTL